MLVSVSRSFRVEVKSSFEYEPPLLVDSMRTVVVVSPDVGTCCLRAASDIFNFKFLDIFYWSRKSILRCVGVIDTS